MTDETELNRTPDATPVAEVPQVLTRDELYVMVWKEPMLRVGERLGVSSSYMARVCTDLRVPRPQQGHWTKLEFGKPSPQVPLPAHRPGDPSTWDRGAGHLLPAFLLSSASKAKRAAALPVLPTQPEAASTAPDASQTNPRTAELIAEDAQRSLSQGLKPLRKRQVEPAPELEQVVDTPSTAKHRRGKRIPADAKHELVSNVRHHFLKTRRNDDGLLRPFKRLLADILVSEALLDETLETANKLYLKLTSLSHRVTISPHEVRAHRMEVEEREKPSTKRYYSSLWSPDRPTLVYIDGLAIGLTLFEMTEEVEVVRVNGDHLPIRSLTPQQLARYRGAHHWTSTRTLPSGRLCLQAYSPHGRFTWSKQWRETKPGQLVKLISEIARELEAVVPEHRSGIEAAEVQAAEEQRKREAEWEASQLRARLAREAKNRQDARNDLMVAITAWDEAQRIANYFDAAERCAQLLDESERERVAGRLSLARELVGEPDPLALLACWKAPDER